MRDLPEWLEDYTDNLDDTEVLVPAHVAQNADSERPTRVASNSRRHSVFNSLPKKTEIAKYACEPKLQGLLAEDAVAKQYLRQRSWVT